MAILANFPLSYSDQVDVLEIFNGLKQQVDDPAQSLQATLHRPISSPPNFPDPGLHRGPSGPQ